MSEQNNTEIVKNYPGSATPPGALNGEGSFASGTTGNPDVPGNYHNGASLGNIPIGRAHV